MTKIYGKSVLVVDDDAAILRAVQKVLTGEGANVATASWAGEVIERLDENQGSFDLIITDLRMPILNGERLLRAVKAALPKVPVIVITAFGSPEKRAECRKDGAAAFLEKPLDTSQLLAAIDEVITASEAAQERSGGRLSQLWTRSIKPRGSKRGQPGRGSL